MKLPKRIKVLWKRQLLIFLPVSALVVFAIHPPRAANHPVLNQPQLVQVVAKKDPSSKLNDEDCPFRESPLYRSVFVYPNPHTESNLFEKFQSSANQSIEWPWMLQRERMRQDGSYLYDVDQPSLTQFSLDLVVYEMLMSSCLRTWNPETAKLFFVPFLPSAFRRGGDPHWTLDTVPHTSVYEEALAEAMMGKSFDGWEDIFGLDSRFWKRRNGTDHVVVMPEPLHGLYHPKGKRGFHHYVKTQKQLMAPIVISVEVSRTFVETYPQCSQKNILVPYPNIDGRWFNGYWDKQAQVQLGQQQQQQQHSNRPLRVYYDAGNHGECLALRKALQLNYECGSGRSNRQWLSSGSRNTSFPIGMRMATFCPCPGGDSPSAKRMYDAVLAGCIPVILSHDFVWPFSSDALRQQQLNPHDFALHLDATQFSSPLYQKTTTNGTTICNRTATVNEETLEEFLVRTVSPDQIASLQEGVKQAARAYSFFQDGNTQPVNPLREEILPSGGAAIRLVDELALRAETGSEQWMRCQKEKSTVLQQTKGKLVKGNKC